LNNRDLFDLLSTAHGNFLEGQHGTNSFLYPKIQLTRTLRDSIR